ncbi:MAG TPA: NAD(P)-dependent oxidoreductase [Solirubrobacteraceae bacterium]|nr:NAD(P)-dependent oxidoreductase [Solirubrobacteraceae bacterium]
MGGALRAGSTVAFIGLGRMGLPMVRRLAAAGYNVRGYDLSEQARDELAAIAGAQAADSAQAAAAGADVVVLMLPSSAVVGAVLLDDGLLEALAAGVALIDMSSSEPLQTRALAPRAAARGVNFVDAPVSGGVRGAIAGSLTIMAGGDEEAVEACRPLLETLGTTVRHVGPVGAGHALKALNNLLSAVHLLASCEALAIGRGFGLDPHVLVETINVSTGRSASTERKLPEFILTGSYDAGFALSLMVKDIAIAVSLGEQLGIEPALGARALELWREAAGALGADADHTEIARWVDARAAAGAGR